MDENELTDEIDQSQEVGYVKTAAHNYSKLQNKL